MQRIVKNVITCSLLIGNCILAMNRSAKACKTPTKNNRPSLNLDEFFPNDRNHRNGRFGYQLTYTDNLDKENKARNKARKIKADIDKRKEDEKSVIATDVRKEISSNMTSEDIARLASALNEFLHQKS